MDAKTLVVGDVHGCLEELLALLKRAEYREGTDKLVLVGDLIDRGPDSVGVVRLAKALGAVCVRGNHEDKHLKFRRDMVEGTNEGPPTMPHPDVHQKLERSDWEFLEAMPLTHWVSKNTVVVHGGFAKDSPAKNPSPHACRIRYVDPATKKSVPGINSIGRPRGAVYWTEAYAEKYNVIYGHHTHETPLDETNSKGAFTLGIDTGCCYGGYLTGYWVEDDELVCVKSQMRNRPFFS